MSMHKQPLTELEREGLMRHGLKVDQPSQLSDAFRQGMAYALASQEQQIRELRECLSNVAKSIAPIGERDDFTEATDLWTDEEAVANARACLSKTHSTPTSTQIDKLLDEIDQLRTEFDVAILAAESASRRLSNIEEDAFRYHWMKHIGQDYLEVFIYNVNNNCPDHFATWHAFDDMDRAIDSAMLRYPLGTTVHDGC